MTTHRIWDDYLRLIAGGMTHDAARAKLAELHAVELPAVDNILASRGDMQGDPDPDGFNATLREKAFRNRVTIDLSPTDTKTGA